ncbi:hypothetical protein TH53_12325 [Pedobacter lusitanus]|uniref:Uncharacterized protein n=1 Tax=Pedobacter lusitanus TaxID=1503925 RepID=A0A0D0GQU7_9SPHI|nr:hypothetical protein TH53_12325 [Pedobacter lusitanus]
MTLVAWLRGLVVCTFFFAILYVPKISIEATTTVKRKLNDLLSIHSKFKLIDTKPVPINSFAGEILFWV